MGEGPAEPMRKIVLRNLVYDWIQKDPTLKEHITLEYVGEEGFYILTKCEGKFALAWVTDTRMNMSPSLSSPWEPMDPLNPADPEYFQKIEALCRDWHNTYSQIYSYACKTKI